MECRSAMSLVCRDGETVLVVKRSRAKASFPGAWSLPSTYVHEGETVTAAAQRLAKRKLGITDLSIDDTPIGTSPVVTRETYQLQMADYVVSGYTGIITLNTSEYTEARWVTPKELLRLIEEENEGVMGECTRTFLTSEQLL